MLEDSLPKGLAPGIVEPLAARNLISKVPQVTAVFWITKVLTTGMGEITSDYLAHTLNPLIAVGLGGLGLSLIHISEPTRPY